MSKKQTGKKGSDLLSLRFPLLAASPATTDQVKQELSETETEFARRLRRGSRNRIKELQNLERDLEISVLREQVARLTPIELLMKRICGPTQTLLDAREKATPQLQAESIYLFDSIQAHPELRLLPHALPNVQQILQDLKLDDIGIALFRYLTSVDLTFTTRVGADRAISRQSLWERSIRLQSKMWELRKLTAIQSLVESLERRNCRAGLNGEPALPIDDPLVKLAFDNSDISFPSVFDVVRFGLWIWSAREEEHSTFAQNSESFFPLGVITSPTPDCKKEGFLGPNVYEELDPNFSELAREMFKEVSA
jgi:hypothetical protein